MSGPEYDIALMQAVESMVDSLSIHQTKTLDENFTVRQGGAADATIIAAQQQQQEEADTVFGPKPADSDFLAAQLLACYRGEIATSTQAGEYLAVNAMPDAQCRIFKKKMKKRIHEWEAAVRVETGEAEVRAARKTPLRTLYELYRASKNRISNTASGSEHASHANSTAGAATLAAPALSRASDGTTRGSVRSDASGLEGGAAAATAGGGSVELDTATRSSGAAGSAAAAAGGPFSSPVSSSSGGAGAGGVAVTSSSSPSSHALEGHPPSGAISEDRDGGLPAAEALIDGIVDRLPHIRIGTDPPATMPTADLYSEKHQIKQILHRFENDVFHALGYRPPRSGMHRRRLSMVYRRYGELKAELQLRTGSGGSTVSGGDTQMNEAASTVSR